MESGGRLEMYRLMGLVPPAHPVENKKTVPVIMDRTGQSDKGRYSGLKMKLVTDDSLMEQALLQANEKARAGQRMRSMIEEEDYQQPFAGKRNNLLHIPKCPAKLTLTIFTKCASCQRYNRPHDIKTNET